jgi:hypothetical protein
MRMAVLFAAVAVLLGISTARSQEIYEKKDKFDGTTHYFTKDRQVKLEGGSFFSERYVDFSFHVINPVTTIDTPYYLHVNTTTPDWIFISAGGSLILKLDGSQMLTLTGPGSLSAREVLSASMLLESASYVLSEDQLQRIGVAKTVEFRVLGDRQNITGSWSQNLIADAASLALKGPLLIVERPPDGAVLVNPPPAAISAQPCPAPSPVTPGGFHAKLGVRYVPTPKQFADMFHMTSTSGVLVAAVDTGSVADASGIRVGDVILRVGDKNIGVPCDLTDTLAAIASGTKVAIGLWHNGANSEVQAQF